MDVLRVEGWSDGGLVATDVVTAISHAERPAVKVQVTTP